ncbi:MAG: hypothetical protein EOO02_16785 [Chitinophagaceae bacterium]|nr:MAG: hypothetical protein EOO02_16785 [Chitinophagaceae bacterium]
MVRSIKIFLAKNYMEFLLVTWYCLHVPLLILFISQKVGYYYYIFLILISSAIYHLVRKRGNRQSLSTYFVITILGYLIIMAIILSSAKPDRILSNDGDTRWLVARI